MSDIQQWQSLGPAGDRAYHSLSDSKPLAFFDQVKCLRPKGSFTLEIFPDHFLLKSKDKTMTNMKLKVPMQNLLSILHLPQEEDETIFLTLILEPEVEHLGKYYGCLIFHISLDDAEEEMIISLPSQLQLEFQYPKESENEPLIPLSENNNVTQGPMLFIMEKLLSTLGNTPVTFPAPDTYWRIECTCELELDEELGDPPVNKGYLYPLEDGMIFAHPQYSMYIRFSDVETVDFRVDEKCPGCFNFQLDLAHDLGTLLFIIEIEKYFIDLIQFVRENKLKDKYGLPFDFGYNPLLGPDLNRAKIQAEEELEEYSWGEMEDEEETTTTGGNMRKWSFCTIL